MRLEVELPWGQCTDCDLSEGRRYVVLGEGSDSAKLLFLGEGPGADEDETGRPFVGKTGQLLRAFIQEAGLRPEEYFLDNVVCCRSTDAHGKDCPPRPHQIGACRYRLREVIYELDPVLVVALGATAYKSLTGRSDTISNARGHIYPGPIPGWIRHEVQYPVFAMYHPSYLERTRELAKAPNSSWKQTKKDFREAVAIFDELMLRCHGVPRPERIEIGVDR